MRTGQTRITRPALATWVSGANFDYSALLAAPSTAKASPDSRPAAAHAAAAATARSPKHSKASPDSRPATAHAAAAATARSPPLRAGKPMWLVAPAAGKERAQLPRPAASRGVLGLEEVVRRLAVPVD